MSKADNMLSILWLLKTGKKMTAKQLAEALEMNIRTVYRYIDALCASGVPIISDAGHNGGYSLLQHFNEAPLFFDLGEQKALVHAAAFAQEAGYPFGTDLTRAISKLKRYTNEEQRQRIDRHSIGFEVILPPADPALESVLQELELSVANEHTLSMEYRKKYENDVQPRHIDPYGLVHWRVKWYVIAYCHLRREIRSFRADRIQSISRTESTFQRPAGFSARQFFLTNLLPETDKHEKLISIFIKGKQQAINDLCGHWLLGHALVERSADQAHFRLQEELAHTHLPHFLLPFGKSIAVIEPVFVKERLAAIAKDLLHYYQSS
ncbi:helix-turn-helix transcriptional regulator [Brevibacillus sp. NRS-1366]|uniref:helix-turn-helix transcriptional regulator n=1 Tax=Brevibacillus sp. NRS-1366 TaxID=3233899 RepID=UPI003D25ECC2